MAPTSTFLARLAAALAGRGGGLGRRSRRGREAIYAAARLAEPYFQAAAHPRDLLELPAFVRGVDLLARSAPAPETLLRYALGDNQAIACMAFEVLARRDAGSALPEEVLEALGNLGPVAFWFALGAVAARTPPGESMIGEVLIHLGDSFDYEFNRLYLQFLEEHLQQARGGEPPSFGGALARLPPENEEALRGILRKLDKGLAEPLQKELRGFERTRVDTQFLESIGRLWPQEEEAWKEAIVDHAAAAERAAAVEAALEADRPRSVVVVGEAGVGKTALLRLVARRLHAAGWRVFEAGGSDLVAGQSYFGQLEARIQRLFQRLEGSRSLLWYVPNLQALLHAGRHQASSVSVLDQLLPYLETGRIVVASEAEPRAFDLLRFEKPRVGTAFEVVRLPPLAEEATLDLARRWADHFAPPRGRLVVPPPVLAEAWQLTQQFLGAKAAPGNLLELLQSTRQRLVSGAAEGPHELSEEDLLATLGQLTGLPATLLDERQAMDLSALRSLFEQRVMGQPEAVDCLVERVAMIKAGVCDPSRPLGVFLFAGPTGTGKTELAKTLAEFLFGSPERLLRLDMSEVQTPESLGRIAGEPARGEAGGGALVDLVRKQPFSVVLLDEIEKAHPGAWDLFLQVFDDGRLTDPRGVTTDFRHAILIMTTNLGGTVAAGPSLGFSDAATTFSPGDVERALARSFRKEFLNRIDRVVVFRPLSRQVMERILRRELVAAFQRRGLRNRSWAVEWGDDAVEFLLGRGFSPDLGARPLRRAIEQHLLVPLAMATVNRELPEGEQFLFVRSDGGRLLVEFIDPDEPEAEAEAAPAPSSGHSLRALALDARGEAIEVAFLAGRLARLAAALDSAAWRQKKEIALSMTELPGFWGSPERFGILGQAEYLDRIDSSLRTARSQLERLDRGEARRHPVPAGPVRRLAERLHLLEHAVAAVEAGRSWEAFLLVEAGGDGAGQPRETLDFAAELAGMYRAWAERRGMRLAVLESGEAPAAFRWLAAVSGFAALDLLAGEHGYHVLEVPAPARGFARHRVRVRVLAQNSAAEGSAGELGEAAREALARGDAGQPRIVRRYRRAPSPLVRDAVRGWRTGRLDLVLEGGFDLIE